MMTWIFGLAAAFSAAMPVSAQRTCAVSGVVIDSKTGQPVRGATVSLAKPVSGPVIVQMLEVPGGTARSSTAPPPAAQGVSDESGRYCIESVPAGVYRVTAARTGYIGGESGHPGMPAAGEPVRVEAGKPLQHTIRIVPAAVIAGRVYDDEGRPAVKVPVRAVVPGYFRGRRMPVIRGMTETDGRGEFRIAALPARKYYLLAVPGSEQRTPRGAADSALAPTFHPAAAELERAVPVALTPGEERGGVDVRLRRVPAYRVRGVVRDAAGQPVERARIGAMNETMIWRAGFEPVATGPDGAFEMTGLPAGRYTLGATPRGSTVSSRVPVDVAGDMSGIVIAAVAARPVQVAISAPGLPKPIPPAKLLFRSSEWTDSSVCDSSPEGTCTLAQVKPGRYRFVGANLPEGWYVDSISGGGRRFDGPDLDFTPEPPQRLEIALAPRASLVRAEALSGGKPVPGALAALIPSNFRTGPRWLWQTGRTDAAGRVTFAAVRPGEYRVLVWEESEPGAAENFDFVAAAFEKGAPLTAAPGEEHELKVAAIPASRE